jgi:hypothetical protein
MDHNTNQSLSWMENLPNTYRFVPRLMSACSVSLQMESISHFVGDRLTLTTLISPDSSSFTILALIHHHVSWKSWTLPLQSEVILHSYTWLPFAMSRYRI